MRRILSLLVAMVTAGILVGGHPAYAAAWTVVPGGNTTMLGGQLLFTDTNTLGTLTCVDPSSAAMVWRSGSVPTGTQIARITTWNVNWCYIVPSFFLTQTPQAMPWSVNAISYLPAGGVSVLTVTGIKITYASPPCTFTVAGPTATTPGTADARFSNATDKFVFMGTGNLHVWNVIGCSGVFVNGDPVTMTKTATLSPGLTLSSP